MPEGLYFIARDPVHVVVRSEIPAVHTLDGKQVAPKQRRVFAKFERGAAPKWATDVGQGLFNVDSMPDVPPEKWFGFYDVREDQRRNGWTDAEVKLIQDRLMNNTPGVHEVAPAKMAPPYPGYDKFKGSPKALAEKLVEDGYDLQHAIEYERENKNRSSYLSAFTEKQSEGEPEEAEAEVVA